MKDDSGLTRTAGNGDLHAVIALAHEAWEDGDLATALVHFRVAAAEDDDNAMMSLGYFHDEGLGKPRSKHDAMLCYRKAARSASGAASNVAILYRERGNTRAMRRWFERSAAMDDGDSDLELARCHAAGVGTPRSRSRAIAHARRAARSSVITPAGRDEAKALLSALTTAAPRRLDRLRRHR